MPRVILEALDEPDVFLTFGLLVAGSLAIAWLLAPRYVRPRWLLALALMSVGAILATTVVPAGGWDTLASPTFGQSIGDCLGYDAWRGIGDRLIAADTALNVLLYVPAGFLLAAGTRRPGRVVLGLAAMCVAIESWQALSGTRSCTANDVAANAVGAVIGAMIGATSLWIVDRAKGRREPA